MRIPELPSNVGGVYLEKLAAALLIDFAGVASYLIPVVGEAADAVWAPVSGVLIWMLFGAEVPAVIGMLEEYGPGTDILPTATLTWVYTTFIRKG